MKRSTLAPLALSVLALALSGCAAFSDDTTAASDGSGGSGDVSVAAAFYPLQYAAQRVVGDRADVALLTSPGQEPHDLELTIDETALVAQSDLVVYEDGFQASVDDAVEQNATGTALDAAAVVGLREFSDEDHADEDHTEDDHADEEDHSADDGHDHGASGLDPHFWLDPLRMAEVGDAVADDLSDIDPDHADEYAANAADLRSDLEDLDQSLADGLADCQRSTIVVSHDAFGYLDKYGLEVAPIAGLSPEAEPTPADLADLQRLIADDGITTVFGERLASPRLTQTLADDMNVSTAILDPVEGLTDETADEDYLSIMRSNLEALREANGCR